MIDDAHEYWYADFAGALLAREPQARPPGLDGVAARRFAVHRNNTHRALGEALAAAYPCVRRLVGAAFFSATAREYFAHRPQRDASLVLCGAGFADFLAQFAPAASLPYLADVARLERAWLEACHAPDAAALDPADPGSRQHTLAQLRLAAHPAARLVPSAHPIVSLWRHNRADAPAAPLTLQARAEHALVTRPCHEVRVAPLTPAASAFAAALLRGDAAGAAYAAATELDSGFDVTGGFAQLIAAGAFRQPRHALA
jgi:hypothetical protein